MWTTLAPLAAAMSAGYLYYQSWGPCANKLPGHLMHQASSALNARVHICDAYEALFKLNPSYHASPPLLYTVISVPPPDRESADYHTSSAQLGHIIYQLDRKTLSHYQTRDASPVGSASLKKAQQVIDTWTMVGAVLLNAQIKAVYDEEFVGGLRDGLRVKDVLMKADMCGDRWKAA
ncbi:hypothetical protein FZEAL_8096 [Fusarium zealandicum]|uniref:Uncharacterized protein n=1 Tax=Fusarium zealandicum TaxID=1053134 RepID=A0A8H4XI72_9HYPO|nr:hypothetical protein FZEAL_8096 [Fusarium zealandicum]